MAMNLNNKTGRLIGCNSVHENDEIMAITTRGRMIRLAVSDTPLVGRVTMGNILVRPDEGDSIADYSVVRNDAVKNISDDEQSGVKPNGDTTENLPF